LRRRSRSFSCAAARASSAQRLGLRDVPGLVPERFLGALLGGERRRLVDILGAQRGIYLSRSAAG